MKKKINEIHYLSLVSVLTFEPSKSFPKVEAHRCHLLLVSKSSNRAAVKCPVRFTRGIENDRFSRDD